MNGDEVVKKMQFEFLLAQRKKTFKPNGCAWGWGREWGRRVRVESSEAIEGKIRTKIVNFSAGHTKPFKEFKEEVT